VTAEAASRLKGLISQVWAVGCRRDVLWLNREAAPRKREVSGDVI
jgi:hypothetical protein